MDAEEVAKEKKILSLHKSGNNGTLLRHKEAGLECSEVPFMFQSKGHADHIELSRHREREPYIASSSLMCRK